MNWKEQFDIKLGDDFGADMEGKEKVKAFIETEVIEKILWDIKGHVRGDVWQELNNKWNERTNEVSSTNQKEVV